ncbi:MAG: tetratricopeptide repeat protein [Chloroflexi bacterium]|nr:tetratricopeptide repeat protein [Chloroflexota bacterium]
MVVPAAESPSQVREQPGEVDQLLFAAVQLARYGKFEESLEKSEAALAVAPESIDALVIHADLVVFVRGDFASAAEDLRKAISVDPAQQDLFLYLGSVLWGLGDADGALNAIAGFELLGGAMEQVLNLQALVKSTSGDLEGALEDALAAHELAPEWYVASDTLAFVWLQKGDLAQAEAVYQTTLDRAPGLVHSQIGLGITQWRAGGAEGARTVLVEALEEVRGWEYSENQLLRDPQLKLLVEAATELIGDVAVR